MERNYYMLVSLSMQQVHGVKDIRKDYYMLVILPMQQENGARDIRIGIIICYTVCQFDRSLIQDCLTMETGHYALNVHEKLCDLIHYH